LRPRRRLTNRRLKVYSSEENPATPVTTFGVDFVLHFMHQRCLVSESEVDMFAMMQIAG